MHTPLIKQKPLRALSLIPLITGALMLPTPAAAPAGAAVSPPPAISAAPAFTLHLAAVPQPAAVTTPAKPHRVTTPTAAPPHAAPRRPAPTHTVRPAPKPTHRTTVRRVTTRTASVTTGSARAYALSLVGPTQFACLDAIFSRESGWSTTAENPSGAYGIAQALPGSKMASAGADWRTNGATQVRWGISYIDARYGSPCGAWNFWQSHHWY